MRFLELCEEPVNDGTDEIVRDFVDFAGDRLGLKRPPKIKLIRDPKQAAERKSFGGYMPGGGIEINIGNRHIMDVLRTLAHEMVHHKQDLAGQLNDRSGEDGSPEENEANAKAAVIMRLWGKMNPELFQRASILAEAQQKILENASSKVKLHGKFEKVSKEVSNSLPGAFVQRSLRNTDPYMQYRYGVALAGARANKEHGVEFDQESPWAENLSIITFSPDDDETIKLADKLMGVKATRIASSRSTETNPNTVSPVAKPKRNRYGV